MLTGRQKKDFKIILILLALSTALLAVPILAKQQRSNSRNSSNSSRSARNQQVKQASKAPTRIAPIVRSSKPPSASSLLRSKTAEAGISRNKGLSSLGRAHNSKISQPHRVVSGRQTNRTTFRRRPILRLQSSIKTSRISSQITTNPSTSLRASRPSISTPSTRFRIGSPVTSIDSRISSSRTSRTRLGEAPSRSRIGSLIRRWTGQKSSTSIISPRSFDLAPRPALGGAKDRADTGRKHKSINLRVVDSLRLSPKLALSLSKGPRKSALEIRANTSNANPPVAGYGGSSKRYHEHPPAVRNKHRYEHIYWDYHNQLRHRIIWPKYHFTVCYTHGPYFTFRYVYPYHLRRYIFVSLGGYWPLGYRYIRYYWYGCHPYRWYGYYPIAREVTGDTYNYYTYNYYYGDDGTVSSVSAQGADGIKPVDHNTFADVRDKLAKEPDVETTADIYFDEAVKAFEAGDYETAIMKFAEAKELATDDTVLPFAYSQALFANEQYAEAAEVLRSALENVSPEKEGVFYPRGLYSDDETLFEQIKNLSEKAELYSFDADMQLLLGYQLLGTGEIDKAIEPLQNASQDLENAEAATVLLDLLEKISPASGGQGTNTETENATQ
jgi:tetratricopeptide (TPR) repeat protein